MNPIISLVLTIISVATVVCAVFWAFYLVVEVYQTASRLKKLVNKLDLYYSHKTHSYRKVKRSKKKGA